MDDSIYRLRHRDILALCVLVLLCLGAIMVQSASMSVTNHIYWQWTERGTKHLMYAAVALVAFFFVGHVRYSALAPRASRLWRQPIVLMFATACLACVLVLIPHIGMTVN